MNEVDEKQDDGASPAPLSTVAAAPAPQKSNTVYNPHSVKRPIVDLSAMGPQSQNRNGAIKTMMKNASKKKKQQRKNKRNIDAALGKDKPFLPEQDCCVCRAKKKRDVLALDGKGHTVPIPHKPHHVKCPKNTKTKGKSHQHVFLLRKPWQRI